MSAGCGGCNDGCLDESVQLQQGPAGPTGATGATGATGDTGPAGANGAAVIDYKVEDMSSSSSSWTQVYSKTIPANTLDIAYDHLTITMVLTANVNSSSTGGQFGIRVLLGTPNMLIASMFDTLPVDHISEADGHTNGIKIVFDVVCVGADTVATRYSTYERGIGTFSGDDYSFFPLPDNNGYLSADTSYPTTTQTVDTSVNNTLSVRLKSTDNSTLFTLNSIKIISHKA